MTEGEEVRALRWACQAWRHASAEDRRAHAVDAARVAWRLGADAAKVAELGLVEATEAREILQVTAGDDALLIEESFTRWFAGDQESALALLDPGVRIVDQERGIVIDGLAALRTHLAEATDQPAEVVLTLDDPVAAGDGAVLVTAIADVRRDAADTAVEHYTPGWVCQVAGGTIVHVTTYLHAEQARAAAGLAPGVPLHRAPRDPQSWRFARGRALRPRMA